MAPAASTTSLWALIVAPLYYQQEVSCRGTPGSTHYDSIKNQLTAVTALNKLRRSTAAFGITVKFGLPITGFKSPLMRAATHDSDSLENSRNWYIAGIEVKRWEAVLHVDELPGPTIHADLRELPI